MKLLWKSLVWCVTCFICVSGKSPLWNATWTDQLKHDLLLNYDKFARPAEGKPTSVKMNLIIKHVEVEESKSMVTVNAWTKLAWTDEKLKWNSSDYGQLSKINVADHEIWQPDVVLLNSAQGNSIDHYGNTHCLLMDSGDVMWVPPSQFFIFCDINMRRWPFDTQECTMEFGSLTYHDDEIKLQVDNKNAPAIHVDLDPCEWDVISAETLPELECCPETKEKLRFKLTLRRRTPAFNGLVFTPAVVCIVLLLSVFWLPPNSSEKFLLTGATAVIITMFMIYFAQRLPVIAQRIPIIVEFYVYSLILVCVSLVVSVGATNMSRNTKSQPVPRALSRLLSSSAVSYLLLPTIKLQVQDSYSLEQESEELHQRNLVLDVAQDPEPVSHSLHDWTLLAMAIDRVMFIIYILIFTLMFIFLFLT